MYLPGKISSLSLTGEVASTLDKLYMGIEEVMISTKLVLELDPLDLGKVMQVVIMEV